MTTKTTKILSALLAASMAAAMIATLSACGSDSGTQTTSSAASGAASGAQSASTETRTITDGTGRTVEIPATIERIAPLGNAPRLLTYLGLADKFVGIQECEIAESPIMAYAYPHKEEWSKLPNIGTDSMGAGEWYAEELIACKPDVIVASYTADVCDDIQRQTGIPVIATSVDPILFSDEYDTDLRVLGDACNVSDRAQELITCIDGCLADLEERAKDVPDDNKPTVLAAGATFKGGHSIDGVYTNYPVFQILSANDVATAINSEISGGTLVDKEQILNWNPDIIFFDAGSMTLVNTDYQENPAYFESLKAVQDGNLYQWPNSTWHWSNVEIPLVTGYYVGSLLYPEEFKDVNFEEKASEIFDTFLDEPDYLKVLEDAGAGYGPVTLEK